MKPPFTDFLFFRGFSSQIGDSWKHLHEGDSGLKPNRFLKKQNTERGELNFITTVSTTIWHQLSESSALSSRWEVLRLHTGEWLPCQVHRKWNTAEWWTHTHTCTQTGKKKLTDRRTSAPSHIFTSRCCCSVYIQVWSDPETWFIMSNPDSVSVTVSRKPVCEEWEWFPFSPSVSGSSHCWCWLAVTCLLGRCKRADTPVLFW